MALPRDNTKEIKARTPPRIKGAVAGLCAKECARDGRCGDDRASTSSQRREGALLLSQRIGGQLETELLDRLGHPPVLPIP
jgi:hypothetical protein